jgi:hypothetical protein
MSGGAYWKHQVNRGILFEPRFKTQEKRDTIAKVVSAKSIILVRATDASRRCLKKRRVRQYSTVGS